MSVCVFFSGTVAHKIMQKYGFREGQGLGKHEQGLSTALSVEKTSKRGGKIIIGDSTEKSEITYTHTNKHSNHVQAHTSMILVFFGSFLSFRVSCLFSVPCTHCVSVSFGSFTFVCVCFSISIQSEFG